MQLLDIKNVVAGGIAIITAPRGYNYKRIILTAGNSAAANANAPATVDVIFDNTRHIQAKMKGAIQRTHRVNHLAACNALNGAEHAPNFYAGAANGEGRCDVTLYFEEPWRNRIRNNSIDPNVMGWRTKWLPETQPLQIYVPLMAGITPALTAVAEIDEDDNGTPNRIMKWFSEDDVVATATANIMNFSKGVKDGDRFSQISAFNTSANARTPQSVRLEIADALLFEDIGINTLRTINEGNRLDVAGANAIANGAHLVFDANDSLDDTIPSNFAKSLLKIGLSAADNGTIPTVTQRWGIPEGLN